MATINAHYHIEKPQEAEVEVRFPETVRGAASRFATVGFGALGMPRITFILPNREAGEAFALALAAAAKDLTEFYFPEEPGA